MRCSLRRVLPVVWEHYVRVLYQEVLSGRTCGGGATGRVVLADLNRAWRVNDGRGAAPPLYPAHETLARGGGPPPAALDRRRRRAPARPQPFHAFPPAGFPHPRDLGPEPQLDTHRGRAVDRCKGADVNRDLISRIAWDCRTKAGVDVVVLMQGAKAQRGIQIDGVGLRHRRQQKERADKAFHRNHPPFEAIQKATKIRSRSIRNATPCWKTARNRPRHICMNKLSE